MMKLVKIMFGHAKTNDITIYHIVLGYAWINIILQGYYYIVCL